MGPKASVLEFCDRLRTIAEKLSDEQCAALQATGTLGALHAAIVALRAGQVVSTVGGGERLKSVLRGTVSDFLQRMTQEEGSTRR